jgi:hypothetical protein
MSYSQAKARHDTTSGDAGGKGSGLMCAAHGCPNRWCVDAGNGRLCSAHAWAEPHEWPEITQAQQWDETERARLRGEPQPPAPPSRRVTDPARLRVLLRRFADHVRVREQTPKRWAWKLKGREEADPRSLSPAQRAMWRDALQHDLVRQQIAAEEAAAEVVT